MNRSLAFVEEAVKGERFGDPSLLLESVSIDSRTIRQGCLYIPIIGERFDGHDFVQEAMDKGATAYLWQKDHSLPEHLVKYPHLVVEDTLFALQELARAYRESLQVLVIGITGSNGKTSTKDMVASVLSSQFHTKATQGNFNNHIGLPLTILSWPQEIEVAVLEMGMNGLHQIERLCQIAKPSIGVIVNIGEAHIGLLGSREKIADAKWELIASLPKGGLAILPCQEPLLRGRTLPEGVSVIYVGDGDEAQYTMKNYEQIDANASRFCLLAHDLEITLALPGRHQAQNALNAIAIADYLRIDLNRVRDILASVRLNKMRMEITEVKDRLIIINDAYNAAPTSVFASLEVLAKLSVDRRILVFGDMLELGDYSISFHQNVGERLRDYGVTDLIAIGEFAHIVMAASVCQSCTMHIASMAFSQAQEAQDALNQVVKQYLQNDMTVAVLFKGSRGIRLETLAQALLAYYS